MLWKVNAAIMESTSEHIYFLIETTDFSKGILHDFVNNRYNIKDELISRHYVTANLCICRGSG